MSLALDPPSRLYVRSLTYVQRLVHHISGPRRIKFVHHLDVARRLPTAPILSSGCKYDDRLSQLVHSFDLVHDQVLRRGTFPSSIPTRREQELGLGINDYTHSSVSR
jgi:hypothetical protein